MEKKAIKTGDLVTVDFGKFNTSSNTYQVFKKIKNQSVLYHPLVPECLLVKNDSELNNVLAILQSPTERCLAFAKANTQYLGYSSAADIDALCYYFVIKKDLTPKQRTELASSCGKVAARMLNNNIQSATEIINQNIALLDDFTATIYHKFKKKINNIQLIETITDRFSIWNIVGFILAQLHEVPKC